MGADEYFSDPEKLHTGHSHPPITDAALWAGFVPPYPEYPLPLETLLRWFHSTMYIVNPYEAYEIRDMLHIPGAVPCVAVKTEAPRPRYDEYTFIAFGTYLDEMPAAEHAPLLQIHAFGIPDARPVPVVTW